MKLQRILLIACVALFSTLAVYAEEEGQELIEDTPPVVFRPSTLDARIADLSLAAIVRTKKTDGSPALRLTLRYVPNGRALFAEHIPVYKEVSDDNTGRAISIEIVVKRRLTPIRLVAISPEGRTEAETWVIQASERDTPGEDPLKSGSRIASCLAAPVTTESNVGCPLPPPDPPMQRWISLSPTVLVGKQHAKDTNTGASIDLGGRSSFGITLGGGYRWSRFLESLAYFGNETYNFSPMPNGVLLDRSIHLWNFGVGARVYLSRSERTYLDTLLGYGQSYYIRGAGSGYFAAAPFDYPQLTLKFGAHLIEPKRWGRWGAVAEVEARGVMGVWKSSLKLNQGIGADVRLQATFQHPLARLRFGGSTGMETFKTDIVQTTNSRIRFELALEWEL